MSKHGPRYTTAFNDEETNAIRHEIRKLAKNHNKLIRQELTIGIDDWRCAVLPPEVRELALQTEAVYGNHLDNRAYCGEYSTLVDSLRLSANWRHHPQSFPVPPSNAPIYLYEDTAGPFVQRLYACVKEWHDSAVDYGMVLDVFDWLNGDTNHVMGRDGFCAKGDRRHLRTVLPSIVALISRFDPALAHTLAKPLTGGARPPVPTENVPGIMRANQIIAGAMLLPAPAEKTDPVFLFLSSEKSAHHPLWVRGFDALYNI